MPPLTTAYMYRMQGLAAALRARHATARGLASAPGYAGGSLTSAHTHAASRVSAFMRIGGGGLAGVDRAGDVHGGAAAQSYAINLYQLENAAKDLGALKHVVGPGACVGEQEIVMPAVALAPAGRGGASGLTASTAGGQSLGCEDVRGSTNGPVSNADGPPTLRKRDNSVLAVKHTSMLQISVDAVSGCLRAQRGQGAA
jgi:hypothetical protein